MLTKEDFKNQISKLEQVYNFSISVGALGIWYQELIEEKIDIQDLIEGIKLYRKETKYKRFPTLDDLKESCCVVKTDRYFKEAAIKKQRDQDIAREFSKKIKESEEEKAGLIRKALSRTTGRKELAAEMMKLDAKYPGAGWAKEAEALIQ